MDLLNLYLLIERGRYDDYKEGLSQTDELSQFERDYLQACFLVKTSDTESLHNLQSRITSDENYTDLNKAAIDIKRLVHLIFEGDRDELLKTIGRIKSFFDISVEFEELIYKMAQGEFYQYQAIYQLMSGNFADSKELFEKAIKLEEKNEIPMRIAKVKSNYTFALLDMGYITQAQSINFEIRDIWLQTNSFHNLGQLYGNISELFELKGNYNSALYYAKEAEKILEEIKNPTEILMIKTSILRILRKSGNYSIDATRPLYDELIRLLHQNSKFMRNQMTAKPLLELIIYQYTSNEGHIDEILDFFYQLLEQTSTSSYVKHRYDLALALKFSTSGRFRDKIQSQSIFYSLLEDEETDFIIRFNATEYFIELLLFEFRSTRDLSILNELSEHCKKLQDWYMKNANLDAMRKYQLVEVQKYLYLKNYEDLPEFLVKSKVDAISQGMTTYYQELLFLEAQIAEYRRDRDAGEYLDLITDLSLSIFNDTNEEDFVLSDVVLVNDQEVFSISDKSAVEGMVFEKTPNRDMSSPYFVSSFKSQFLLLNHRGPSPHVGLIFQGGVQTAIHQLDYISNVVSLSLLYEERVWSIDQIPLSESVINAVTELLEENQPVFDEPSKSDLTKLERYKLLLHPMRLAIMEVLKKSFSMPRKDLEHIIEGNRGTFASHLTKLIEHKLLESDTQFIDESSLMVIYITNYGLKYYDEFKEIIHTI